MEDRCICCGAIIPEGRQVCFKCEKPSGKEFLETLLYYETDIKSKQDELQFWEDKATDITTNLSLTHGGSAEDKIGTCVAEIVKRRDELKIIVEKTVSRKLKAARTIDLIKDPIYKAILKARYIEGKAWTEIDINGMTDRNMYYLHNAAITEFEKVFQ